jgi:hypothetical protein
MILIAVGAAPAGRRRGEAIIECCRRSTAAGGNVPTSYKAAVVVTIGHADLVAASGAATAVGSLADGTLLAPDTARKGVRRRNHPRRPRR